VAAETGFMIDGTVYEVPTLDSLTMGERRVMFELSGITQEDFVREADESEDEHDARLAKLMRHPGFMESLMHVAYQRGNPTVKPGKVKMVVEGTNYLEAVSGMTGDDDEEEEAVPLALTSEPDRSSEKSSLENESSTKDSSETSGNGSESASDEQGSAPIPIGITRSDTSSISDPTVSAASGRPT
jgi:hypothetical protein